jgi:hypothetical protein
MLFDATEDIVSEGSDRESKFGVVMRPLGLNRAWFVCFRFHDERAPCDCEVLNGPTVAFVHDSNPTWLRLSKRLDRTRKNIFRLNWSNTAMLRVLEVHFMDLKAKGMQIGYGGEITTLRGISTCYKNRFYS